VERVTDDSLTSVRFIQYPVDLGGMSMKGTGMRNIWGDILGLKEIEHQNEWAAHTERDQRFDFLRGIMK
jgi:hypothetical protein